MQNNNDPIIRGGQGRSDHDIETDADMQLATFCFIAGFLALGAVAYFILRII